MKNESSEIKILKRIGLIRNSPVQISKITQAGCGGCSGGCGSGCGAGCGSCSSCSG